MGEKFRLEDPGEGIHEVEIQEILVSEGDEISEGESVFVVESDKAAIELPSPFSGRIASIEVSEGDIVEVGSVLLTVDTAEAQSGREEQTEEKTAEEEGQEEAREAAERADEEEEEEGAERTGVRHRAAPVPATPAVRRMAKEKGIDLREVRGSGVEGRVLEQDLKRGEDVETPTTGSPAPKEERRRDSRGMPRREPTLPDFSRWGDTDRVPLRSIRRATANHMATAWREIPHVTHQDLVDITDLESFRRKHKDEVAREGGKLTVTILAMKALVGALREHPRFNASLDTHSGEIVLKRYFHVGVATDTEGGLVVPVVRDVDRKSVTQLARELKELAERARAGDLGRDELQGGTFTITNIGPLGGRAFQPIINYPEVGILGLGAARMEPLVHGTEDDFEIRPRLMLPLCMAFDHRVNDGADAARFTASLMTALTDLEELVLLM